MNLPDEITFEQDKMRWTCQSGLESELRGIATDVVKGLEAAGAQLLREKPRRKILKLEIPGVAVYIKLFEIKHTKDKLKHIFIESRAKAEWRALHAMAKRNVPTADALMFGERRVAGFLHAAALVTREITDAKTLNHVFDDALLHSERRRLLAAAADLIRRAHDAGVDHGDLHGFNILLSGGKMFLIDVGHVRMLNAPLDVNARLAGLAQFIAYMRGRISAGESLVFVKAYFSQLQDPDQANWFRAVNEKCRGLVRKRFIRRTERCANSAADLRRGKARGMTFIRRDDFHENDVLEAIDKIDTGLIVKTGRCLRVVQVTLSSGAVVCVQEFRRVGFERFGGVFGSSGMRAWTGAHALAVRGIATPRPLAVVESASKSYYISEYVLDAHRLSDYLAGRECPVSPAQIREGRAFIRAVADFFRAFHLHSVLHHNLSAENILVRDEGNRWQFLMADTVNIRQCVPSLKQRIRNLGQLCRTCVPPSRTDTMRFLRRYAFRRPQFIERRILAQIQQIIGVRKQKGKPREDSPPVQQS